MTLEVNCLENESACLPARLRQPEKEWGCIDTVCTPFAPPNQEGWHSLSWCSVPSVRCWKGLQPSSRVPLYPTCRMSIHQYLHKIPQLWTHSICFLKESLLISFTYLFLISLKLKKIKLQTLNMFKYVLNIFKSHKL